MPISISRRCAAAVSVLLLLLSGSALGASAVEIDARVDQALEELREIPAAAQLLRKANGVLIFPRVVKAGFGIGGEYGEGALRIGGESVEYYNTASASIGFQAGGQVKKQALLFMTPAALQEFRDSRNFKVGAEGSVAVATFGVGEEVDNSTARAPIIGFVYGNKGLMYNLTLEGAKFTKIDR